MTVFCTKCGSDIDGIHYAECPDHPTNLALAARGGRKIAPAPDANAVSPAPISGKSAWFKGNSTMGFDAEQVRKVFEYFLNNVLDIQDVEVVKVHSTKAGSKVTFTQRQHEVVQQSETDTGD